MFPDSSRVERHNIFQLCYALTLPSLILTLLAHPPLTSLTLMTIPSLVPQCPLCRAEILATVDIRQPHVQLTKRT